MSYKNNKEDTWNRSLAMSQLLRETPPPARHIDLDVIRFTRGSTLPLYVAEVAVNRYQKQTYLTKTIGELLGIPSFLFSYTPTADESRIIHIEIRDLATGSKTVVSPKGFTEWDSGWDGE